YAQERVLFHDDEDSWYVMVFLNADGTMKDCYLEANDTWMHDWATEGVTVYNMDREQIGTITLTLDNSLTNAFTIDMDLGEAGETLSAMDKTAIYWRCISEINDTYGD
nr:hypothetical protein [Lachnospiraceae bacterium]